MLHGAAPATYRKAILHAKKGLLEQYFKVAQERTVLPMLHNGAYVQHCLVGSRDRFVGVRLHPRTGSSPSEGRSSQNGGSIDRLAYSFHAMPHRVNVKVSNLKRDTVGNSQWNHSL